MSSILNAEEAISIFRDVAIASESAVTFLGFVSCLTVMIYLFFSRGAARNDCREERLKSQTANAAIYYARTQGSRSAEFLNDFITKSPRLEQKWKSWPAYHRDFVENSSFIEVSE